MVSCTSPKPLETSIQSIPNTYFPHRIAILVGFCWTYYCWILHKGDLYSWILPKKQPKHITCLEWAATTTTTTTTTSTISLLSAHLMKYFLGGPYIQQIPACYVGVGVPLHNLFSTARFWHLIVRQEDHVPRYFPRPEKLDRFLHKLVVVELLRQSMEFPHGKPEF